MEVNLKSWEERWAEYLDSLAAADAARQAEEEEADDDDIGPTKSTDGQHDARSSPPGHFGPAASARSTKSAGDARDALDSTRSRMFDERDGMTAAMGSVDISDEQQPPPPPPEPDWRKPSMPQRQPRRPQPPGWEKQQQEREREYKEREREREQQRRRQEEEQRQREEEQKRHQRQRQQEEEARKRGQQQQQERQRTPRQQQQWQKERPQHGMAPPSARAKKPDAEPKKGRFFDSFVAFDTAFSAWEEQFAQAEVLRLSDVPFPPLKDPAGLVEAGLLRGGDAARRKALLRTALLRWHPDKWINLTSKIDVREHGELGRRLSTITQALVEQKAMD
jgi:flagellar biosynthesis GTPase FlhF